MQKEVIIKLLGLGSFFATIFGIMKLNEEFNFIILLLTIISAMFLIIFIKMDKDLRKSKSILSKNKSCNPNSLSRNPQMHSSKLELAWSEDDVNDELYLDFESEYSKEIHKRISSFEKYRNLANEESDLDKQIELLKQTIILYDEAKKWFYETKGGKIYFDIWYEHLHSSRNDDFSYIDEVKGTLEYCTRRKYYIVPTLLKTIKENKNILQKNVYQYMPDVEKSEIQQIIRELEQKNTIRRTKKSNTYLLELTDINT